MASFDRELDLKIKRSNLNEYLGKKKYVNQIDPLVSILVETYQHVEYIEECIKSILMQKTSFPIEIIIGEDESSDGTREKCIEYANKYPDKIRLFLRSRKDVFYVNGNPTGNFNCIANAAAVRGKYTACCEGDDYWIDPYKLEKQVSFMEENPDCSLCCHAARIIDVDDPKAESYIRPSDVNKEFTVEEVILGRGAFISSNSMVYPTKIAREMPFFTEKASFSDYTFAIFLSIQGKFYYINEVMSVYRMNVKNSWCSKMTSSIEGLDTWDKEHTEVLENFNSYTNYKYNIEFNKAIEENSLQIKNEKLKMVVRNSYIALEPCWELLATLSDISQINFPQLEQWEDYWLSADKPLQGIFGDLLSSNKVTIEKHENELAASVFVYGLASAELKKELDIIRVKLAEREEELAEIKCSKTWELAMLLRRIFLFFMPMRKLISGLMKNLISILSIYRKQINNHFIPKSTIVLVKSSGLYNEAWYLKNNLDVAQADVDPLKHYLCYGGFEGRDPGPNFNTVDYQNNNPEVKDSGINPLVHYLKYGKEQGSEAK